MFVGIGGKHACAPKSRDEYIFMAKMSVNRYNSVFYYDLDLLFYNVLVSRSRLCAGNRASVKCRLQADQASLLTLHFVYGSLIVYYISSLIVEPNTKKCFSVRIRYKHQGTRRAMLRDIQPSGCVPRQPLRVLRWTDSDKCLINLLDNVA